MAFPVENTQNFFEFHSEYASPQGASGYPHEKKMLENFVKAEDVDNIEILLTSVDLASIQSDSSLLYQAVTTGNQQLVQVLLNKGFRPDYWSDYCPLIESIKLGYSNIAKMLVEKHCENLRFPQNFQIPLTSMQTYINDCYPNSETPLSLATLLNDVDLAQFLLQNEADINAQDSNGVTALHLAARCRNPFLVKLFLDNGADINHLDNFGFSPLIRASGREIDEEILKIFLSNKKLICDAHCLTTCLFNKEFTIVKFLIENGKFNLGEFNNIGLTPFYYAKIFSKEIYTYMKKLDPQAHAFNQHFFERRLLAHLTNTGGFTDITPKGNYAKTIKIELTGFNEKYLFKFIIKRLKELPEDLLNLNTPVLESLKDTSDFYTTDPSPSQILERWKTGKPTYIAAGVKEHTIGMLIYNNEIVWSNLWQKPNTDYSSYKAFSFAPHLFTEDILAKISNLYQTLEEKIHFLEFELPLLLHGNKFLFHNVLEMHQTYAQKNKIGNCSWINTQGLQLPHAVLLEMNKQRNLGRHIFSELEIDAIIKREAAVCDTLISYYQLYITDKALRRMEDKTNAYEPDCDLISRAFIASYPYSADNNDPAIVALWKVTEKRFNKLMPKKIIFKFKHQKDIQDYIGNRIDQIDRLLSELNDPPHKRRKITHGP